MRNDEKHASIYEEVISKFNQYNKDFALAGTVEYIPNKNPISAKEANAGKIAKIIIIVWLSLLGLIFLVVVHSTNLSPAISNQPIGLLIAIYLGILSAVILLLRYYSKRIQYIKSISVSKDSIYIQYSKSNRHAEAEPVKDKFALCETVLCIKRSKRNDSDRNTSRRTPFIVSVKRNHERKRYRLFTYDKSDMLAFVLFLEYYFHKANIIELTSTDIETMYYSSNFGLKMLYTLREPLNK